MKNHTLSTTFFLLFGLLTIIGCKKTSIPYDLIIQNGMVVDGTGTPAFRATIAIKKDKIVKISKENIDAAESIKLIDAGQACQELEIYKKEISKIKSFSRD